MSESIQSASNADIRLMEDDEIAAVEGGFLGILGGLFAVGFAAGVVACNIVNHRPWYEF